MNEKYSFNSQNLDRGIFISFKEYLASHQFVLNTLYYLRAITTGIWVFLLVIYSQNNIKYKGKILCVDISEFFDIINLCRIKK